MEPRAPSKEEITLHPLELVINNLPPTEVPSIRQQNRLVAHALNMGWDGVPTKEEIRRVATSPDLIMDMIEFANALRPPGTALPGKISLEQAHQELEEIAQVLDPIAKELFGLGGRQETSTQGIKEFLSLYPTPWEFGIAWARYCAHQRNVDQVLLDRAYDAAGHTLYGKRWEYMEQIYALVQEHLNEEALEISTGAGRAFAAGTMHTDGLSQDALSVGKHGFALVDGVGSGGHMSGDIANFIATAAHSRQRPWAYTSGEAARAALDNVLDVSKKYIQDQQASLQQMIRAGKRPEDVIRPDGVDAVGIIGFISVEESKDGKKVSYLNFKSTGNCRVYVIDPYGNIKLVTRDRTLDRDYPNQFIGASVAKLERARNTVTTAFSTPEAAEDNRVLIAPGDVIVAMSDGVTGTIASDELEKYLKVIAQDLNNTQPMWTAQIWAENIRDNAQPHSSDDITVFVGQMVTRN